jgi:hypothetical protein
MNSWTCCTHVGDECSFCKNFRQGFALRETEPSNFAWSFDGDDGPHARRVRCPPGVRTVPFGQPGGHRDGVPSRQWPAQRRHPAPCARQLRVSANPSCRRASRRSLRRAVPGPARCPDGRLRTPGRAGTRCAFAGTRQTADAPATSLPRRAPGHSACAPAWSSRAMLRCSRSRPAALDSLLVRGARRWRDCVARQHVPRGANVDR